MESNDSQHNQTSKDHKSVSESTQILSQKKYFSNGTSPAETLPDDEPSTTPLRPSPRVRFRSRVRITSALHHHRHKWSRELDIEPDFPRSSSLSSSVSSSRSSSISAPLRSHPNNNGNYNSSWGPLGQRVSLFISQQRDREALDRSAKPPQHGRAHLNERTPLASSPMRSSYVEGEGVQESDAFDSEEDDVDNVRLSREIDLLFGKWPRRLLNYRWWWWQFEPVFYCHCMDELEMYD